MIELPGIRRISLDEYFDGVRSEPGEPFWVDQCLWDIANTMEAAIRNAARAGAKAVTLYWGIPRMTNWRYLIDICKSLDLAVVLCHDDYHRELYWSPPSWHSTQS